MKMDKTGLINKINERVTDIDMAIELIEDITDSFDEPSEIVEDTETTEKLARLEQLESELMDLKQKYKDRFMQGAEDMSDEPEIEELKEEKLIDIKEI